MRPTTGFLEAVRLVAFANLPVTVGNCRSLWWPPAAKLGHAKSGKGRPAGDLWQAFSRTVLAYLPPDDLAHLGTDNHRVTQWTDLGRNGKRISPGEFVVVHRHAQEWLDTICADGDLTTIVRTLQRRFQATQRLEAQGECTRVSLKFRLSWVPPKSLETELHGIFASTASSGLWPRFYRCDSVDCREFAVARQALRPENYCSTACRVRASRSRLGPMKKAAREAEKRHFRARVTELRGTGESQAFERACKEFGYPPSVPPGEARPRRRP